MSFRSCRRSGLWAAIALALVGPGCGKKGAPSPPIRYIPAPTEDLTIHQQGRELNFELGYPQSTVGGLALPGLEAVEIWELVVPIPPGGERPRIDAQSFSQAATQLLTLQGPELASAVTGDRIDARVVLADPLPVRPELHVFAVRTVGTGGDVSAYSNRVALMLREPLPPPHSLRVIPHGDGITVHWQSETPKAVAFHVYRRDAQQRSYGPPLARVSAGDLEFLDASAEYGRRYIYTVRAVESEDPQVESAPAGEQEIDYRDHFAPAPPRNLLALAEEGQVRLVWGASDDGDTVGYYIYRQDLAGEFRRLTPDPVSALEYLDQGLARDVTFHYRVSAVDGVGNEGETTPSVAATVR